MLYPMMKRPIIVLVIKRHSSLVMIKRPTSLRLIKSDDKTSHLFKKSMENPGSESIVFILYPMMKRPFVVLMIKRPILALMMKHPI